MSPLSCCGSIAALLPAAGKWRSLNLVRVRAFVSEDFEAAYRLDQACYPPGIAYSRFALGEFLSAPGARAWVAEDGGELVGLVIVRQVRADRGHLITLDVRADRRRRGIGRTLLETAEAWLAAQGVGRMQLETAVENRPAVAFWQQAGYQVQGILRRYYLDRDDAYRMQKELGSGKADPSLRLPAGRQGSG